jgi:hypothetical protein
MTPRQIINNKFTEKCQALRHFHQMFQNALFRPTTTASEWEIRCHVGPDTRIQASKECVKDTLRELRLLKSLRHDMQVAARTQRKRKKATGERL